eukprot:g1754.t1
MSSYPMGVSESYRIIPTLLDTFSRFSGFWNHYKSRLLFFCVCRHMLYMLSLAVDGLASAVFVASQDTQDLEFVRISNSG